MSRLRLQASPCSSGQRAWYTINLDGIPDQKVIANVVDANEELAALYREFDETVRKSEIQKEEGEADMIRMLDTARAIPNTPPPTTISPMQQMQKNALKKPVR